MDKTFFITTAIDYTNAAPHIGHAYEKILADVLARYHRLKGEEVFFLTGVDQHGQKVQQSAEKQGIAPQQFVDGITQKFIALWDKLDVRFDRWAATTDPLHKECVGKILTRLRDEGQLYKAKQGGYYSIRQEQFLTDKERGPDGEFGPEWGQVEFREEENYYFKLAEHKEWLLSFIKSHEKFVTPSFRQNELINAVEKLSGDLCISRPKARLEWGIEFPFDPDFVTYVWFDALVNYISFAEYDPSAKAANKRFRERWPALHVIGKDILIPAHGVYWPIMLHALGFADDEMPQLLVHGWWNIAGAKMSKSLGNAIDPDALADKYGAEALRYYLMSDISTGKDADFSEERLREMFNGRLANSLGNLLNRCLNMSGRFCNSILSCPSISDEKTDDSFVVNQAQSFPQKFTDLLPDIFESYESNKLESVCFVLSTASTLGNQLVDDTKPWILAKSDKNDERAILQLVLFDLAESLRIIAILISPILPKAAHGIFDQLQWKLDEVGKESRFKLADVKWGGLPDGHQLGKPTPLFPRIEIT